MKKNLIKKVFAVSLSIAMACSLLPAANPVTASAAAPYVSLKTTFKTLKVGQSYKMTLKNNTVSWKIKKVETTDKPIATVYGKTTSSVMIKGKSEGRATIRVKLKTTKRKKNNTKTLRCRVKVVTSTPSTVDPTPTQTDATVTTQQELTDALANTSITKITIKPASAVNFTIPSGTYSNVDLIVNAPQSDITNSATFKSITVENIKPETWTENGAGNAFTWKASNGRLVVGKGASVRAISIPTASKVAIHVQEGTVAAINVTAKAEISLTGKLAEGAAAIAISFSGAATDAKLTTAIKVAVTTLAKIAAIFEKGAEDSTIKLDAANISVDITNNTTKAIEVTKNNNTKQSVSAGHKGTVSAVATPTNPGGSSSTNGGSSGGTYKPATTNSINTGSSIKIKEINGTVTDSAISVASKAAINFTISEVKANTPAAIEYNIVAVGEKDGKVWRASVGGTGWKKMDVKYTTVNNKQEIDYCYKEINAVLEDLPMDLTFEVQFRVAETSTAAASSAVKTEFKITLSGDGKFDFGDKSVKF